MIAPTSTRVENSTSSEVNQRIREQTRKRVAQYENATPQELTYRLAELDQEWDIERVLELNFSSVVLVGTALGTVSNRKWYALPAVAACFMIQHVLEGWCPPVVVLRRLGFRTAAEINHERVALKSIRGDFVQSGFTSAHEGPTSADSLLRAAEG
jgi:hypothetical protein